ncbi:hypothetical protein CMI37_06455 [Candidatus Pacearchaeota archaeon]|jgi:hypothetical protein|nr:hypothetical protein [Candidatus Pacearchaeota archaeon]|tara:strand:- start:80 stop:559 length:480 start_codon:yes stop_codon:yes gene_type:complete
MTKKDLNKEAFKEAEKELMESKVDEIKEVMKSILQAIQTKTEEKAQAEESLRLLKLDMADLKDGKLEKIKQRHAQTKKAPDFDLEKLKRLADGLNGAKKGKPYIGNSYTLTTAGAGTMYLSNSTATNFTGTAITTGFCDATSGTYHIVRGNGTIKEFYL